MSLPSHSAREAPSWSALYGRALEWLVMALMILLFLEVMLGIVFRASGHALSWYDEVASIMLAWLTFYGSALASHKRAHIGCPEIVEQLSGKTRWMLEVLTQLLVISFFALLAWVGFSIMPILATDTMTSLPDVPMNIVQSVIPVSSLLILVSEVQQLIAILRKASAPDAMATLAKGT
jgi:TRAP-type C4-dicarboxylate transport system permease small subunit